MPYTPFQLLSALPELNFSVFPHLVSLIPFLGLFPLPNRSLLSFRSSLRWQLPLEVTSRAFLQWCFLIPWASILLQEDCSLGSSVEVTVFGRGPRPFHITEASGGCSCHLWPWASHTWSSVEFNWMSLTLGQHPLSVSGFLAGLSWYSRTSLLPLSAVCLDSVAILLKSHPQDALATQETSGTSCCWLFFSTSQLDPCQWPFLSVHPHNTGSLFTHSLFEKILQW